MRLNKKKANSFLWIICFMLLSMADAYAGWNNFVVQFKKETYGKGSQTWQIAPYSDNWIYFANKNGMLQYDGCKWSLYSLNNGSDVRAVYPSVARRKIYVAGINEFGYFSPDIRGKLVYTCLSDSLKERKNSFGNVWNIYENDNIFYWQADSKVLKFLNGKYSLINSNAKIDCSNLINGTLFIGTNKGVMFLVGNSFFPLQGGEALMGMKIRGFIPYDKGIIIATAFHGLFYWNGSQLLPFITGQEAFFSQNEIFSIATSGNMIAVGTVRKGLVVLEKNTHHVRYFDENNGLQNNTVLSLRFDTRKNLWAGLDNGIDYICLNSNLSNLYTYPYSYGAGYSAFLSGQYLYLGTNRGLYYTHYPVIYEGRQPDINQIPGTGGQVWDIAKVGNDLFCFHDGGLFLVNGTKIKRIGNLSGVWNGVISMTNPNRMLVGLYEGIAVVEKENGEWKYKGKIYADDSAYNFEQESGSVLWLHNNARGVVRYEIDPVNYRVKSVRFYGKEKGLPSNKNVFVSKISGKLYFTTDGGIYVYNRQKDAMEYSTEMNKRFNEGKPYFRLYERNNQVFGLSERNVAISDFGHSLKKSRYYFFSKEYFPLEMIKGFESMLPISDSLVVIPNDCGFALLDLSPSRRAKERHRVRINSVQLSYPNDSLIYSDNYLNKKYTPEIAYSRNSIRFKYDYSSFTHSEDVKFRYRLNDEDWSEFTYSKIKEYSNLREGKYNFQLEAVFYDGSVSKDSFTFIIRPPWYRTKLATLFYSLLLLLLLRYLYNWEDNRVKRNKQQIIFEKDKELLLQEQAFEKENARKEHQIMELEKEKLEYELQHKSQEMTNLMINFVRKNEILTEIKQELFKVTSSLKGEAGNAQTRKMLTSVSNKIDSNIQSDDVLKRIEEQFDLLHNNFMKRLGEKHPNLSVNEHMMCAYLKMNLSSKEIASLMNISIRGVETIRYRLRRKFNLDRDENLTDYICNKL